MNIAEELLALKSGQDSLKTAILASIEMAKNEVIQHSDQLAALKARIAELEALETVTPEQKAELDALRSSQDDLIKLIAIKNPEDPATLPTDPPTDG